MLQNKIKLLLSATAIMALIATMAYLSLLLFPPLALAAEGGTSVDPGVLRWGYMAAALATGLSALAAGIAVGGVGAAYHYFGSIVQGEVSVARILDGKGMGHRAGKDIGVAEIGIIASRRRTILIVDRCRVTLHIHLGCSGPGSLDIEIVGIFIAVVVIDAEGSCS